MPFPNTIAAGFLDDVIDAVTLYDVALYTTLPDLAGVGGVEFTAAGYARCGHSTWETIAGSGTVQTFRTNSGPIAFLELAAAVSGAVGFALWDGSTMIALGRFVNSRGVFVTFDFVIGDRPRFVAGELRVS